MKTTIFLALSTAAAALVLAGAATAQTADTGFATTIKMDAKTAGQAAVP